MRSVKFKRNYYINNGTLQFKFKTRGCCDKHKKPKTAV